jgi:ABC-type lipopolysaccharide export system ATPase subunit
MFLPDHGLLSRRLSLQEQLGFYATAFGGNVEEAAAALDILDCISLRTGQLSGGEERRAELALARLRRPECLVADEPFAGISPLDRERVVAVELRAHADRGAAVLVTGHEVEDLVALADDIVWVVAGTTHALGTPNEATLNDQVRREYLGRRA